MLHPLFSEQVTEYIDAHAAYQIKTEEKRFYSISPKNSLYCLPCSLIAEQQRVASLTPTISGLLPLQELKLHLKPWPVRADKRHRGGSAAPTDLRHARSASQSARQYALMHHSQERSAKSRVEN